jgi:type I restriction enzyme S subunit
MKLSDLCWIPTSLVDPRLPVYCDLPHIGSENIEKGTGRLLKYHTAREDGIISGKYPFTDKDVLYSKIRPHLEKACYPRFSGVCGADIYPLRCTEKAIPEYLLYILLSEHFTSYSVSVSMRSKMPKVNQNELYAYERMVPSPQEQIAITNVLTAADERLNAERDRLRKLENIKRGLMDDLVTNRISTDNLQGGVRDGIR